MVDKADIKAIRSGIKSGVTVNRDNDPAFYNALSILPNPDPILRKRGLSDGIYDAIASDAHVKGELRSIRAGLIRFHHRVIPGSDGQLEKKAAELCAEWLKWKPAPNMMWPDVFWNMGCAVFRGLRVHAMDWGQWGSYLMPLQLRDIPNRRCKFNNANELRFLTKSSPIEGIELPDHQILLSRHMPSAENPYGEALFSSCVWPYTFKHGAWKFFYRFCEKHGIPWPIGRYPVGTPEKEQNEFAQAIEALIESGFAVIPEGDKVELLTVLSSGELPQERMIQLANSEISMALTSQSIISNQKGVGSFAASKTSRERETSVNESDRSIIEATMNTAFEHITRINFGDDVIPPTFNFYKPGEANKALVETYKIAAEISDRVDLEDFHARTGIKMAAPGAATLRASGNKPTEPVAPDNTNDFATRDADSFIDDGIIDHAQTLADDAIEKHWLNPVYDMLSDYVNDGKSLDDFLADLPEFFSALSDDEVVAINEAALKVSWADGYVEPDTNE